jgi:hypothetical protein
MGRDWLDLLRVGTIGGSSANEVIEKKAIAYLYCSLRLDPCVTRPAGHPFLFIGLPLFQPQERLESQVTNSSRTRHTDSFRNNMTLLDKAAEQGSED